MSIEVLLAEREIHRALVRFARAMDERDWSALDALVLEDATADLGTGPLRGRAAIVSQMRSFLDDCGPTQHLLGNLLIDVDADTAQSRVYVSDVHLGRGDKAHLTFSTLGDYHDRWCKQGGVWRIAHRIKRNRALLGYIGGLGSGPPGWSPRQV
jgi:hypothetical protein